MSEPTVEVTYDDLVYLVGLKETELFLLRRKTVQLERAVKPPPPPSPPPKEPANG